MPDQTPQPGEIYEIGDRLVRVLDVMSGRLVKNWRGAIAVRNMATHRLSYVMPERLRVLASEQPVARATDAETIRQLQAQIADLTERCEAEREWRNTDNDSNAYLRTERHQLQPRVTHTEQFYAVRLQHLEDFFRGPGRDLPVAAEFWNILANGRPGTPENYQPPTYAQLLNAERHRAEAAEARVTALSAQVERLTQENKANFDAAVSNANTVIQLQKALAQLRQQGAEREQEPPQ